MTVRLLTGGGSQVATTVTDADGEFEFTGLRPGTYRLEIDLPDGFVPTQQNKGSDDEKDSDFDDEGEMEPTSLTSGERDEDWDVGLVPAPPP